jgi:DNA polymerase III alpha subunit
LKSLETQPCLPRHRPPPASPAFLLHGLDDDLWQHKLESAGAHTGVPLVAAGNVHMHVRSRKPLQDVLTAVRLGQPVMECGFALQPNAEAHLRPGCAWPASTRPSCCRPR